MILKLCKYYLFVLSFYYASAQVDDIFIDSLIKNEDVRFFKNLEYGDSKRNKLDLLIPKSKIKTPLVVFLHGGGYKGGNKESSYKKNNIIRVRRILRNKIAFATINYSFLNNNDGLLSSLNDAKLALQFLKYNHLNYNIDRDKVIIWGVSSGANSVLWLGLSDDMAEVESENRVLRESTSVKGIIAINGAHSFNSENWKKMINMPDKIFDIMIKRFLKYPGMDVEKWLVNYKLEKYQQSIDYFNFMDSSDPALFIGNYGDIAPKTISSFNHHPMHAKYLKQRADSLSITNYVFAPQLGIKSEEVNDIVNFIIKQVSD